MNDTPQFHIVVRRPGERSPLAPYRFVITLAFAMAVCGLPLWRALETGHGIDDALLRIAGAALLAWLLLGRIDKILRSPYRPSAVVDTSTTPTD